jgi:hypothetical protein
VGSSRAGSSRRGQKDALCSERVGTRSTSSLGVPGASTVDVELLGHLFDLGIGEGRHPLGDVGRSLLLLVSGGEDDVDCFEGSSLGLGVEEVDDGDEERVGDGEDEEGGPADRGGHSGSDLDDEEVEQPVGHSAG